MHCLTVSYDMYCILLWKWSLWRGSSQGGWLHGPSVAAWQHHHTQSQANNKRRLANHQYGWTTEKQKIIALFCLLPFVVTICFLSQSKQHWNESLFSDRECLIPPDLRRHCVPQTVLMSLILSDFTSVCKYDVQLDVAVFLPEAWQYCHCTVY